MMKRIVEFDLFRIFATLLVVIGHINVTGLFAEDIGKWGNFIVSHQQPILTWIYTFHMPAFAFLSGMCLNIDKYSYSNLLYNKFHRLIIPYFGIGLFVLFPVKILLGTYVKDSLLPIVNDFFTGRGGYDHLWFLLVLFWCFLVMYIPLKYVAKKCLWGCIIAAFLIQRYITLIDYDFFLFKAAVPYFMPFTLGYIFCVSGIREKFFEIKKSNLVKAMAYVAIYFVFYRWSLIQEVNCGIKLNIYILIYSGIILLLSIVYIAKYYLENTFTKYAAEPLIRSWSKGTFSVYVLHVPLYWICNFI